MSASPHSCRHSSHYGQLIDITAADIALNVGRAGRILQRRLLWIQVPLGVCATNVACWRTRTLSVDVASAESFTSIIRAAILWPATNAATPLSRINRAGVASAAKCTRSYPDAALLERRL